MNADGLCQILLTTINAELASVPGQSDTAKIYAVYISTFQLKLFSFIEVFASPERKCVWNCSSFKTLLTQNNIRLLVCFIYTVFKDSSMEHQREIPPEFRKMRVQENETVKVVDDGKGDNLLSTAQKATFKICTSHRESALIPELAGGAITRFLCYCSVMQTNWKMNVSKR